MIRYGAENYWHLHRSSRYVEAGFVGSLILSLRGLSLRCNEVRPYGSEMAREEPARLDYGS